MRMTCPCCATDFPIEAGLLDADGKRLAALLAGIEPVLARAVIGYLRMFKPAKTALRTSRAVTIVAALDALVRPGSVCRDERGGVRRPATPATWAAGIEQLLASPPSGLPLANHHYLRAIVFGLADEADAQKERAMHEGMRAGQHRTTPGNSPARQSNQLDEQLAYLAGLLRHGRISQEQHDTQAQEARRKAANGDE